ncbi:esterase/lipase family protein [Lysobacter enzymogenes]|uniref:esterase/lipase family protein n=1 Tax=Lysobacter enzymogenes TaxID=69 RepID=UPI00099DAB4C|nr:alpha/beta fold hydrolase [Lysobacter enzymogenes]UZW58976.1 alpha/beta fold hydrolase [Lysobacter enzymogenes]
MSTKRSAPNETGYGGDLRGIGRLTIDAITGVADLVESVHATIAALPGPFGAPVYDPTRGLTGQVYRGVRGVARLVGGALDLGLAQVAPWLDRIESLPQRDAAISALNGVLGDHLDETGNPLAIGMRLCSGGRPLPSGRKALGAALPQAGGKLVVFVHGLCMNDRQWRWNGHDYGAELARDAGWTPVYLRYNSGRHISFNGRDFSARLDRLLRDWPVPVERLAIVCHSMGGLVARSACHAAVQARHGWIDRLDSLVFLGTPHQGAPLERAGSWFDTVIQLSPYTAPFARLGKIRSAGIQDLRHGNLLDSDWRAHADRKRAGADARADTRTPVPLPKGVRSYAIAVSTDARRARDEGDQRRDDPPSGDGLVPVASALGQHRNPAFDLRIPASRQWLGYGLHHLDLLGDAQVYAQLRRWLKPARRSRTP